MVLAPKRCFSFRGILVLEICFELVVQWPFPQRSYLTPRWQEPWLRFRVFSRVVQKVFAQSVNISLQSAPRSAKALCRQGLASVRGWESRQRIWRSL